jgi:hypothetical protein
MVSRCSTTRRWTKAWAMNFGFEFFWERLGAGLSRLVQGGGFGGRSSTRAAIARSVSPHLNEQRGEHGGRKLMASKASLSTSRMAQAGQIWSGRRLARSIAGSPSPRFRRRRMAVASQNDHILTTQVK